ncbi:MAG: type IV secretory system conjugative DNA transfer family protein [Actinomycetota bacterium]|nr:type IV secretory system conjugative DNA transfer family protein [Actinomycetota bacterium]
MSTTHTHHERTAERSLLDTLALPIAAALVALAGAVCALTWAAAAGATLAGSQRLPTSSFFAGLDIAQRLTRTPAHPWLAWPTADRAGMPHDTLTWYAASSLPIIICVCLLVVVILIGVRIWRCGTGRDNQQGLGRSPKSERGSGRSRVRLTTRPVKAEGRITLGQAGLGQVFAPDSEAHVMVVAPPGQHKTTGVVIPAVLQHPGPALVVSTKPDVLTATLVARARRGDIFVYDPFGERSCGWNPVDGCTDWETAMLRAEALTTAGKRDQTTAAGEWWDSVAGDLLAPLLHAAALDAKPMHTLFSWVAQGDAETPRRILATQPSAEEDARWRLASAIDELDAMRARDDRTRASTWLSAGQLLKAYRHPAVARASQTDFHPSMLLDTPSTLYIVASDEHQQLLRPIIVALIEAVYQAAFARGRHVPLDPRFLMALDETANIAPLRRLPEYLAQSRGVGITMMTVWQGLSQTHARYGEQAGAILASSLAQVFLGGSTDPRTLDYLERMLRQSELDPAQRIDPRRLGGRALVIYADHQPFLLRPRISYQNRHLRRLAKADPR